MKTPQLLMAVALAAGSAVQAECLNTQAADSVSQFAAYRGLPVATPLPVQLK